MSDTPTADPKPDAPPTPPPSASKQKVAAAPVAAPMPTPTPAPITQVAAPEVAPPPKPPADDAEVPAGFAEVIMVKRCLFLMDTGEYLQLEPGRHVLPEAIAAHWYVRSFSTNPPPPPKFPPGSADYVRAEFEAMRRRAPETEVARVPPRA